MTLPAEPTQATDTDRPEWTYPTRFCRICREDVAPTVTMYPPGLPLQFQRPIVEYKNDDDYGRLIKPCQCRGSSRYIHELCLLRSRTENRRAGSMWKCHECGYQFNFQRLTIQRFLSSKASASVLTVLFMLVLVFVLGFVADPIINLYVDPYDTIRGRESVWDELEVQVRVAGLGSGWSQHFLKGTVSMGLVGFLKTVFMNPWHWFNLRNLGLTSTRTTVTGRDRAVNISWAVVLLGVISAFYVFYHWVQALIQKSLQRIGNHIVDTQLPGDDDDLKPPPGWSYEPPPTNQTEGSEDEAQKSSNPNRASTPEPTAPFPKPPEDHANESNAGRRSSAVPMAGSWPAHHDNDVGRSSGIDSAQSQGWSFSNL